MPIEFPPAWNRGSAQTTEFGSDTSTTSIVNDIRISSISSQFQRETARKVGRLTVFECDVRDEEGMFRALKGISSASGITFSRHIFPTRLGPSKWTSLLTRIRIY